jgi:hypothetical protein
MAAATNKPPPFRGFERPSRNYFKMPNNWTDITAEMSSLAEIKVVDYVFPVRTANQAIKVTVATKVYKCLCCRVVIGEIRDGQLLLSAGTLATKPHMAGGFVLCANCGCQRRWLGGRSRKVTTAPKVRA